MSIISFATNRLKNFILGTCQLGCSLLIINVNKDYPCCTSTSIRNLSHGFHTFIILI